MEKYYCEKCGYLLYSEDELHKCPPLYFGCLTVKAYLRNRYPGSEILEMEETANDKDEWSVTLKLPTGAIVNIVVAYYKKGGYLYNKHVKVLKTVYL